MVKAKVYRGLPIRNSPNVRYEQTATEFEVVAGLLAMRGSTDAQVKLTTASTDRPVGYFPEQIGTPTLYNTPYPGSFDTNYARNGDPVQYDWGLIEICCTLANTEVAVQNGPASPRAGGECGPASAGDYVFGQFAESADATDGATEVRVKALFPVIGGVYA